MPRQPRFPKLCLHKSSGRAYVKWGGKRTYLGKYNSDAAAKRYAAIVARLSVSEPVGPPEIEFSEHDTVERLVWLYLEHCEVKYRGADGKASSELGCITLAMRRLCELHGDYDPHSYGPRALSAMKS